MTRLHALIAKPWLPGSEPAYAGPDPRTPPARLGLRVMLAVVASLFLLLTIAYLSRAQLGDWQSLAGQPWGPLERPWLLWFNSGMLMAASIALHLARLAVRRNRASGTRWGLALGGLLTAAFLAGQLVFWQELAARGYFLASNPANAFFYLITGLHGIHLLAGLLAWSVITTRAWRGDGLPTLRVGVELCSVYWHFLFAVWLLMFALLTSSDQTLGVLAALCGMR